MLDLWVDDGVQVPHALHFDTTCPLLRYRQSLALI